MDVTFTKEVYAIFNGTVPTTLVDDDNSLPGKTNQLSTAGSSVSDAYFYLETVLPAFSQDLGDIISPLVYLLQNQTIDAHTSLSLHKLVLKQILVNHETGLQNKLGSQAGWK